MIGRRAAVSTSQEPKKTKSTQDKFMEAMMLNLEKSSER